VSQEWWDGEGQIFLAWGILNPNGPTLYVLGSKQVEGGHRIFMRWLHMLGGSTTYAADTVDQISYQRIYDDATSIHEHLVRQQQPGLFQVIPSFLIVNRQDPTLARIAADLVSNCGGASESWGRHMAYLRQFGADFFGLAGAQIREYYDDAMAKAKSAGHEPSEFIRSIELRYGHLPEFINATIPASSPSPMTPELRDEWWRVISARDYKVQALASLKAMWDGASSLMSDEYKDRMVPWDAALGFLARFGLTLEAE
jgi:hypothetical protein